MMNRRKFLQLCATSGLVSVLPTGCSAFGKKTTPNARPNVVFILVDDLGWMDLNCQGSAFYKTPNLDRFAASGVRFTDAYAACPVCSPTRAAILTG